MRRWAPRVVSESQPSGPGVWHHGAMGLYREQLLPRLVEVACGGSAMERWRARTTEGLEGRVVEIGPLLDASHASLRDDYEVSAVELDVVVEELASTLAAKPRLALLTPDHRNVIRCDCKSLGRLRPSSLWSRSA